MAENKKSFILYCDLIHTVKKLSNQEAGKLFKAILNYVNKEPYELDKSINKVFENIVTSIEAEWNKYNPKTKKYHWNYKGGITPENKAIRSSAGINFWRVRVFERDNYTCQDCGKIGGELNSHHIKPFATHKNLRTELDNGITLCKTCHIKAHKKEVVCD